MQTETSKVSGMSCDRCTSKIAYALKTIAGVHEVVVSLQDGSTAVRYDELLTTPDQLISAVKGAGYVVNATSDAPNHHGKGGGCG